MIKVTKADLEKCLNFTPKTIETSLGTVEYGDYGEGPVLLSVHGGPGGFDQALGMCDVFRKNGFRVIGPSRPGYLGTPLGNGTTPKGQADVLAALLDALNLDKVAVVGCSAGGPPAYSFAEYYPEKVSALMAIDTVCIKYTKMQEISKATQAIYLSKPGLWLVDFFMRHFPEAVVKNLLQTESSLDKHELGAHVKEIVKDEEKFAFVNFLMQTMMKKYDRRKVGVDNDLRLLEAIDKLPVSNIKCPTLIIHGDADSDVPMSHAKYANSEIKNSELYVINKASHIGFWAAHDAEKTQEYAIDWLKGKLGI